MTKGPYTQRSARSASFFAIGLRIPSQIATVFGYIVLVRLLSESEFGVYSLFYAALPTLGTLVSFGMENALKRYQPEFLRRGENRLAHGLSRRIGLLRLLTMTISIALVLTYWDSLAPFFKIETYRDHFLLFAIVIMTHFQCQILTLSLSAHLLQRYSVGMAAVWSILKVGGYLAADFFTDFNLWMAVAVDVIAYLVYFVGLKIAYLRTVDYKKGTQDTLPPDERRRLVRYAAYYSFNDAGTLALDSRKESFFLAAFLDTISVGAYAFASRFNLMIGRVSPLTLLDSVIQPMFVSLDYSKDPERIHRYFTLLINTAFLVRIPLLGYIAVFHSQIVEVLFAGRFLEYSHLLAIVALFSLGQVIGPPITLVAQMEEKAQFVLASKVFGIVSVGASLLLIPKFGVVGAAVASGVSFTLKNFFIWWFVRTLAVWRGAVRFVIFALLIWGGFALVATPMREAMLDTPLLMLISGGLLWLPFAFMQLRAAIGTEQRQIIGRLFSGKENRLLRLVGLV